MATPTQELDKIYNFDFTPQPGEDYTEAKCPDGTYRLKLVEIGKPFVSKAPKDGKETTKAVFTFEVIGEANRRNQLTESEYEGVELKSFINVDARGEKATIYKLVSSLFGEDPAKLGVVQPSKLLGKECWGRVSSKPSTDGEKIYTNIDEFLFELPKVAAPNGKPAPTAVKSKKAEPEEEDLF